MPFRYGKEGNRQYIRWGSNGKKFYYKPGDKKSRERAKKKADEDRKRIEYFKHK